jgi:antitoxin FitA
VATLTIRDLEDEIRTRLRVRAAQHGRSMEAEVREILRDALAKPSSNVALGSRIRQRFAGIGGVDVAVPTRTDSPRAADLG